MSVANTSSNPFCTRFVRPDAVEFIFVETSVTSLVTRLRQHDWNGQIIGPHGSGKSTLINTLIPRFVELGRFVQHFTLHDGQRSLNLSPKQFDDWPATTQLIVDGYEQLSWINRVRLVRQCRRRSIGLLVTAHKDMGLSPIYQTRPAENLFRRVVEARMPAYRDMISDEALAKLLRDHDHDFREALMSLYDVYQRWSA